MRIGLLWCIGPVMDKRTVSKPVGMPQPSQKPTCGVTAIGDRGMCREPAI
jgi:hypothetical protein